MTAVDKPTEYYWVPEQAIFDNAADATEFMNLGAGCLVADHVVYDELKRDLARYKMALEACRKQRDDLLQLNDSVDDVDKQIVKENKEIEAILGEKAHE